MQNKFLAWLVPSLLIGATGCPDIKVDPGEGVGDMPAEGPIVEFDPSAKILPFPNNLVLDPATGKVNLPEQCNESATTAAIRTKALNTLDGFGTFELPMQVTFTEAVDEASLVGKVVLYKRATGTTAVDPLTAMAIPLKLIKSTTIRYANSTNIKACTDPKMIDSVVMVPLVPLDQKSTYVAAILKGVKTASGADYGASFTWSLIRQEQDPVTLADASCNPATGSCAIGSDETPLEPNDPEDLNANGISDQLEKLNGIDLLWKAHNKALTFLAGTSHAREDILVAWEFNTQTVTDPLDPTVTGSLASKIDMAPVFGVATQLPGGVTAEQFLQSRLPAGSCSADGGSLPCNAVGDIVGGLLNTNNYQVDQPAKVTTGSTNPNFGGPIPGGFSDPVNPTKVGDRGIAMLGLVRVHRLARRRPCLWVAGPVIIFGHGLGSSKTTLVAIGSQFAAAGYASVAIDFVAHDSRAVRISTDAAIGCADSGTPAAAPPPTSFPQCYAPFLSSDLGATRDNIRQSVLDLQELVGGLKGCGTTACGPLKIDVNNISYVGISLGGIMGSTAVAANPGFRSAVLNVPGVGWADILENSQTNGIKCPLVDALIDAKILTGEKWNPSVTPNTGLCTTDAWKAQPGYASFAAIGRWVLDPADGANFTRKLATRKILIQEVVGDLTVPNIATNNEAALVGLTGMMADAAGAPPIAPSAAITTAPTTNKFVKYMNLAPNAGVGFPGNTFEHPSLLRPAPSPGTTTVGSDGRLGTARLQTDAITFLVLNKAN
ncbi:MAG: hypothetical protein IPQ07_19250 [Myxococcales bacterium]|nr:hypothetical protein [Myxococcales bacterium]